MLPDDLRPVPAPPALPEDASAHDRPTRRAPAYVEARSEDRPTVPWTPPRPLLDQAVTDPAERRAPPAAPRRAPVGRRRARVHRWMGLAALSFGTGLAAAAALAPRLSADPGARTRANRGGVEPSPGVSAAVAEKGRGGSLVPDPVPGVRRAEANRAGGVRGDAPHEDGTAEQAGANDGHGATDGRRASDDGDEPAHATVDDAPDVPSAAGDASREAGRNGDEGSAARGGGSASDPAPADPASALEPDMRTLHRILPELESAQVKRVIDRQRPRMQRCYDRALRRTGRADPADVRMVLDIARDGHVDAVRLRGGELGPLHSCLQDLARRWTFPASRSGARVPLPLEFTPRG